MNSCGEGNVQYSLTMQMASQTYCHGGALLHLGHDAIRSKKVN